MHEEIVTFGENNRLTGIITCKNIGNNAAKNTAVIIINAGLVHRSGPNRFHADLARLLCNNNFITLRFDISGIGDSKFSQSVMEYREYVLNDTDIAMKFLTEKTGITGFILIGLCSGADNIHMIAMERDNIKGCVFLDAYGFPTGLFHVNEKMRMLIYYFKSFVSPSRLFSFIRKKLIRFLPAEKRQNISENTASTPINYERNWLPQKETEANILNFIQRGIRLLYIYSGGVSYYNYTNQFFDMFPKVAEKQTVSVKYFPGADHTYTLIGQREKMLDSISSWINESF